MERKSVKEKSKDKLIKEIEEAVIREAAHKLLDLAEVSIGDKDRYNVFRAKALRILNNAVRQLELDIRGHYVVEYESNLESVAQVTHGKQGPRR